MRFIKILLLHFETLLEHRLRAIVWFLGPITNSTLFLLFWRTAIKSGETSSEITLPFISSYYLLLIVVIGLVYTSVEYWISNEDVQEGGLTKYLLKPHSYFWMKFAEILPTRILLATYGVLIYFLLSVWFGQFSEIVTGGTAIGLTLIVVVLAFLISFALSVILGLLAFWFTDMWGFLQFTEAVKWILGGIVVPISLLPPMIANIAYAFPFAYILYYPIVALQGTLTTPELSRVILLQCGWLVGLMILYKVVWAAGIKKFTAVGQ